LSGYRFKAYITLLPTWRIMSTGAEQVTYQILCGDTAGSGFGMTSKRDGVELNFIVTNYHFVEQCLDGQEIKVLDSYYDEFTAEVMSFAYSKGSYAPSEKANDLAPLRPNVVTFQTISDYSYAQHLGSWVIVAGFPEISNAVKSMVITTGVISSKAEPFGFTTTADISPGSSGSMIMNSRGEVIGVVFASYESDQANGTSMFLPLTRVAELLNDYESE
jgi:S1-C subfamily serine protease